MAESRKSTDEAAPQSPPSADGKGATSPGTTRGPLRSLATRLRWSKLPTWIRWIATGLLGVLIWEPFKIYLLLPGLEAVKQTGRHHPMIVVVGPVSGSDADIWRDVLDGVASAITPIGDCFASDETPPEYLKSSRTIRVALANSARSICVAFVDDQGSKSAAVELAKSIVDDPDVVLVVGHLQSGIMEDVLPVYGDKVSVIMPVSTNPRLTDATTRHVLRLAPTDDMQAELAVQLIERLNAERVAVFRDSSVRRYSDYLADGIRDRLEELSTRHPAVVLDGSVSTEGPGSFVTDSVAALCPDALLFAGMGRTAVPLVWQANEWTHRGIDDCPGWQPAIILTDGAGSRSLGNAVLGTQLRVRLLFPLKTKGPPSYAPFGHDAMLIGLRAATDAAGLSRRAVWNFLDVNRATMKVDGLYEEAAFNRRGDNTKARFHANVINGHGWVHDAMACSCGSP